MAGPATPTRQDPLAARLAEVLGGPAGWRLGAGRAGWWTPARVLVLLAPLTVALAALTRDHCRATLWSSPDQFVHACYSDVPTLVASSGLADGAAPYAWPGAVAEPVGTGGLLWLLAALAPSGALQPRWVFDLAVLLVAVALVVTVLAVLALAGPRPWDAALVAASPVVVVAGVVSLDLVAAALVATGLLATARRRAVPAGVLLGLAAAVQPLAACVVPAVLLGGPPPAAAGDPARREARAGRVVAVAVLTWLAATATAAVPAWPGFSLWWRDALSGEAGYGSLWLLPQLLGAPVPAPVVLAGSTLAALAGVLAVARWASRSRPRPATARVAMLLLVTVGLALPALPVQAAVLLLPLAALAVPRWRDHALWAGAEAAYATGTWLYLYGLSVPDRGLPPWAYSLLLLARAAAWVWLAVQAVRAAPVPAGAAAGAAAPDAPAGDAPAGDAPAGAGAGPPRTAITTAAAAGGTLPTGTSARHHGDARPH